MIFSIFLICMNLFMKINLKIFVLIKTRSNVGNMLGSSAGQQTPYSIDLLSGLDNNIVHSQLWLFQWSDRLDLIVQLGWNYLAFHGEHFVCDV